MGAIVPDALTVLVVFGGIVMSSAEATVGEVSADYDPCGRHAVTCDAYVELHIRPISYRDIVPCLS
jgi:hypothetical protein